MAACLADVLGALRKAEVVLETSACADVGGAMCARACAHGDAAACYARALKAQGEKDPTSAARASARFRKACELGLPIACTNYAAGLWISDEQDDIDCSQRIFEKTCAAKEPWGCGMLGRMIIDVEGAGPDELERGRGILERACDELGSFSCRVLALELEEGKLGPYKRARIRRLLARACATGDDGGCGAVKTASATFHDATASAAPAR